MTQEEKHLDRQLRLNCIQIAANIASGSDIENRTAERVVKSAREIYNFILAGGTIV